MKPKKNLQIVKKHPEKLRRMPKDPEELNLLADELIMWALKDDSVLLERFPLSKMMSPYLFFKFAKSESNEYFTDAFDFARSMCGVRMQEGNHAIDNSVVLRLLPLYNREYGDYLLQKEQRTLESSGKSGSNIVVNMEVCKSDIVPTLKSVE